MRNLLPLLACTACLTMLVHASPQPEPDRSPPVADLIAQLSDKQFKVREQATATLATMPVARLALAKASKSADAEVAQRAKTALAGAKAKTLPEQLERLKVAAKNGEPDIVSALMTQYEWPPDDNRPWQAFLDCIWTVLEREKLRAVQTANYLIPPKNIEAHVAKFKLTRHQSIGELFLPRDPRHLAQHAFIMARAKQFASSSVFECSLLAIDTTSEKFLCLGSMVLSSGSFIYRGGSYNVLISDGDIEAESLGESVLICSGNVWVKSRAFRTLIRAGGQVKLKDPQSGPIGYRRSDIRAGGPIDHDVNPNAADPEATLEPNHANPLGKLRFFGSSRVGVEKVTKVEAGVRIDTLAAECKLAGAGLRVGDIVTAVDDAPTLTPDSLRRALRTAWVNEYGFVTARPSRWAVVLDVQF